MEFYQVYLIIGIAMALVMLLEAKTIHTAAVEGHKSTGIPVVIMTVILSIVVLVVGTIAWPWVLFKEIQYSKEFQNGTKD